MSHKHGKKESGKADSAEKDKGLRPAGEEPAGHPAHGPEEEIRISLREFEDLQARLKELEGMRERFLLAAADFDNAKKRLLRERDEFVRFSVENLIRHLLPVLDNFERAFAHAGEIKDPNTKAFVAGIQMVFKQMTEALKNQGLSRLQTAGGKFDPHFHEAVSFVEGGGEPDEILEELEAGYMLHDRLLRAAKVRIRIAPSGEAGKGPAPYDEKQEEIT